MSDTRPMPALTTLRAARLAARLRQADLAARAGVSRALISTVERAPELLTRAAAERLAPVLGLVPEDILARPAR